jgi:hypothetical protein
MNSWPFYLLAIVFLAAPLGAAIRLMLHIAAFVRWLIFGRNYHV